VSRKLARSAGVVVQAVVLGYLLFFAVMRLAAIESGATIFRYQGF
jgi:hypothetical protein